MHFPKAPGLSLSPSIDHTALARPSHGQINPAGIHAIRPPRPTACVRTASLIYHAPTSLDGVASRHLRRILRTSSLARHQATEPVPASYVSLCRKESDDSQKITFEGDAILDRFLVNNGGYLDDSDSGSESDEDEDLSRRYDPPSPYLPSPPATWSTFAKKSSNALHPDRVPKIGCQFDSSSVFMINGDRWSSRSSSAG